MKPVKYLALFGFVTATIAGALVATQNNVASSVEAATVAEEPTGPLHLETSKVKSFSDFHFETMEGPSGDTITTYYFAAGSGAKADKPEVRFITDGTNTSSSPKVFAAVDTTEVHFWYKLANASEVSIGDPDKPYMIQFLDSDGGYNAVNWDPVNDGEWHVTKFTTDTKHDKFCGFVLKAGDINGSLVVADIRTYKTAVTDLETVFPESFNMNFSYDYIDNGFFDIALTERIFTTTAYINDHYNEFLDVDGNVIPLRDGIVINGKTLKEWIDYDPAIISYPRNDGVTCFPVHASSQFNPIAIEAAATALSFKFSLEEIPLDSVVVTFKAGLFYGYYNNTTFTLDKDITYYANVTTSNGPSRIVFSKTPNWIETYQGIREVVDWGEETASQGGKYHRWLIVTNIARDEVNINQACPADNYRYMFDNILMNGKSLTHYNAWARGNSKDFTDLADTSTQNPAYEVGHPTGSANTRYDYALRIEVITDQARYYFAISVPNQLLVDLSMVGNPTFALRDGSAWLSIVDDQSKVVRYDAQANADFAAVTAFANNSLHMADYNESLGYCKDNEHHYYLTAKAAYNALTDSQKAMFRTWGEFAAAKARYEKWAEFNGDAAPYDGNDTIVSSNSIIINDLSRNVLRDYVMIAVTIASVLSISAVGVFFLLKKKKHN